MGSGPASQAGPCPAVRWAWLGRVPFDQTAALQEALRARILAGAAGSGSDELDDAEWLLLCEHHPVITLGRRARDEHVLLSPGELARRGIDVRRASRGGDVTYHGPGQLIGYPVFRLRRGVVAHVEAAALAVIEVLGAHGIAAQWRRSEPGVWVDGEKICAFGVHVRRGVAIHGFALNVTTELDAFSAIVPCGLRGVRVTSMARLGVFAPPLPQLARSIASACARTFARQLRESDLSVLPPVQVHDQAQGHDNAHSTSGW